MVQLRFREVDRDLFEYVQQGRKRYELRANTERFRNLDDGDPLTITCGGKTVAMRVKQARRFADLEETFRAVPLGDLLPGAKGPSEAKERISRFPGYAEKIKKHGVVVLELEPA